MRPRPRDVGRHLEVFTALQATNGARAGRATFRQSCVVPSSNEFERLTLAVRIGGDASPDCRGETNILAAMDLHVVKSKGNRLSADEKNFSHVAM